MLCNWFVSFNFFAIWLHLINSHIILRWTFFNAVAKQNLFYSDHIVYVLYETWLWCNYIDSCLSKFQLCYHRCIKMFFDFMRIDSVTQILLQFCFISFSTMLHNSGISQSAQNASVENAGTENVSTKQRISHWWKNASAEEISTSSQRCKMQVRKT